MAITNLNQMIMSDWSPLEQRLYRFIFSIRPAILSTFLKQILGVKRGWISADGIKFHVDPIARCIGAVPGDIIKITRPSASAGEAIIYRVCAP